MTRAMQVLTRGDGAKMRLRTEGWQHDPYTVHMPCTPQQISRTTAFRAASQPVQREDGNVYSTTQEPLRWGCYGAKVMLYRAAVGMCPHCQAPAQQGTTR